MDKPQIKEEVAIVGKNKEEGWIVFWANPIYENAFSEYGVLTTHAKGVSSVQKQLLVDGRYDFDEVLEYMESYGEEGD